MAQCIEYVREYQPYPRLHNDNNLSMSNPTSESGSIRKPYKFNGVRSAAIFEKYLYYLHL